MKNNGTNLLGNNHMSDLSFPNRTPGKVGSLEAIREATRGPLRAAGDAAGSLSLRRPLRRREGGGTSGPVH